jgi:hypothetical protein
MTKLTRKAAIAAYKEVKSVAGIYSVTCAAEDKVWVGESRNLAAQPNSLWFMLRLGSHRTSALQAAFDRHGEAGIVYAELERLPEEELMLIQRTMLKDAALAWIAKLGALRLI